MINISELKAYISQVDLVSAHLSRVKHWWADANSWMLRSHNSEKYGITEVPRTFWSSLICFVIVKDNWDKKKGGFSLIYFIVNLKKKWAKENENKIITWVIRTFFFLSAIIIHGTHVYTKQWAVTVSFNRYYKTLFFYIKKIQGQYKKIDINTRKVEGIIEAKRSSVNLAKAQLPWKQTYCELHHEAKKRRWNQTQELAMLAEE